jgi:hypothetical protein
MYASLWLWNHTRYLALLRRKCPNTLQKFTFCWPPQKKENTLVLRRTYKIKWRCVCARTCVRVFCVHISHIISNIWLCDLCKLSAQDIMYMYTPTCSLSLSLSLSKTYIYIQARTHTLSVFLFWVCLFHTFFHSFIRARTLSLSLSQKQTYLHLPGDTHTHTHTLTHTSHTSHIDSYMDLYSRP